MCQDIDKLKVGILTLHNAVNYGSVLQTYATQKLFEMLGYYVEIIDYRNAKIENDYKDCHIRVSTDIKGIIVSFVVSHFYKKKKKKFAKFFKNYMHISTQRYDINKPVIKDYDVILVGSDLVWDLNFTGGFDLFYWGNFEKNEETKLIAWAASMYVNNDSVNIKENLLNFDAISVREYSLKKYISQLTDKDVAHIIDPTLLLSKERWSEICVPIKEKHYVLVYTYTYEYEVVVAAKRLADIKGLSVIVINPMHNAKIKKGYKQCAGPAEFVSYIKNADYVVANSLHATAFAINFNKQFYSFMKIGTVDARRQSLLIQLGLENRIISENENFTEIKDINYTEYHDKLELLRSETMDFVREITPNICK